MNIAISMEITRVLRNTWHSALNCEWYEFLVDHAITPLSCHGEIDLDGIDLVMLAGGNDMPNTRTWRDNHYPVRDQFERRLIDQAQQRRLPIVGVCRGAHFMNLVMGGTHRVMEQPYDNVKTQLPSFEVTCHHTIQIVQLAPGFEILEQDPQGVIELAVNRAERMLGIGWHPERAVNAHTRQYILDLIGTL